jgi:type VI secretion system secreted protein VgrG
VADTQANRPLRLTTPLGPDALLLTRFAGTEALSQLFTFQLSLLAPSDKPVDFSKILGQPVLVELEFGRKMRYFHGIVSRFSQGRRDNTFVTYSLEMVPQFWLLTRVKQSRIFQHVSVPDILKTVLKGLKVKWEIQGNFQPRDYCVQYRESDFEFASRLMEEEGIYYYFLHENSGHTMVVANTPQGHSDVPIARKITFEELRGGNREDSRITEWVREQELRSGKVTLWDHCFELPHKHLEADKKLLDSVQVGKVTHKLQLSGITDKLEIYDFPGAYAQRFDGVDRGGGDKPADLDQIFSDNKRTVEIRAQQEQAATVHLRGTSTAHQLTAGHKFTLDKHYDADGDYVLLEITHDARMSANYRTGEGDIAEYSNHFSCLPFAVPYRPPQRIPKPTVHGTQTAVVVGPAGEEIFCDKYGRVKVQFHWDRQGKNDADSSCWIRVATIWAGKGYGIINVPRIGQEVIVDFLEGDPDQPIIVGSVYNADQMPAFGLPGSNMVMGFKSNSTPGGGGYNEMTMNDTKGTEKITIHGQYDMNTTVEHDQTTTVHNCRTDVIDVDDSETVSGNQKQHVVKDQTVNIDANRTETVGKNETITIHANRTETVDKNESITVLLTRTRTVGINESVNVGAAQEITVGGLRAVSVGAIQTITVGASQSITVGAGQSITVGGNETESYGKDHTQTVAQNQSITIGKNSTNKIGEGRASDVAKDDVLKVGKNFAIDAGESIVLKTGEAMIEMKKDGTILIQGKDITVKGSGEINVKADKDITMKGKNINQN